MTKMLDKLNKIFYKLCNIIMFPIHYILILQELIYEVEENERLERISRSDL